MKRITNLIEESTLRSVGYKKYTIDDLRDLNYENIEIIRN